MNKWTHATYMNEWIKEWLKKEGRKDKGRKEWNNDWVNECMNELMKEWMNEWLNGIKSWNALQKTEMNWTELKGNDINKWTELNWNELKCKWNETEWMSEWMNALMNEWLNERMNEWMSVWWVQLCKPCAQWPMDLPYKQISRIFGFSLLASGPRKK